MALALFYQLGSFELRRMVLDEDSTFPEVVLMHHNQPDEGVVEMMRNTMPSIPDARAYLTRAVAR